ncbi:MAG: hypothetical protein ACRD1X_04685 [Vicinamibacteria bacterium]
MTIRKQASEDLRDAAERYCKQMPIKDRARRVKLASTTTSGYDD